MPLSPFQQKVRARQAINARPEPSPSMYHTNTRFAKKKSKVTKKKIKKIIHKKK